VQHDALLQERNFGDLRGTPYALLTLDPFAPEYAPPNGETWDVFHARVDRAWALVRARAAATDGHLAVVTHGLVCRSLAARHLLLADGEVVPERWENTAVTVVERAQGLRWPVRLLNCVAHLDDLAARSPLTLPSPLRGEGRGSGAV
jgi:broad specificity phosphatase PhoE